MVGRIAARVVPEQLFPDSANQLRQARLVALFCVFTFALTIPLTLVQAFFGSPRVMVVAGCGVLALTAIAVLRRTRSVVLAANILVALYAAGFTAVTLVRGGFGAPIVMGFAVVPMLALALAGRRSGMIWLVLTLLILCVVGLLQLTVGLPRAPLADPVATNWPGHLVFVVSTYVLMAVYVNLRKRAMEDQQAAEEQLWRSERRRLASETEAQLLRSSRMAELGTLAAGVAHEINNPLSFIQNNLDYLKQTGPEISQADREEIYGEIRSGARRIARIVRDVGSFSRVEEDDDEVEPLDVRETLDSSVNLVWNQIRHRATLRRNYQDVPRVAGSTARLGQVFVNLLTNALQAIPDGSADDGLIEIRVHPGAGPKPTVAVEIQDNGCGVSPEVRSRAFEPFYTTKPMGVGTGLGLSICYGIVNKLGGEIRLDSEEGGGTTVTVELPVSESAEPQPRPESTVPAAPAEEGTPVRILLIDDDQYVARATARALGRHQVTVVTHGRDALLRLEAGHDFDVVLCDLMMPEMTGMELHQRLERSYPQLARRVIFITGGAFTQEAQDFLRRTGNRCLEKPIDLDELEQAVLAARG